MGFGGILGLPVLSGSCQVLPDASSLGLFEGASGVS